ncbi:hypothetical protein T439DRAFT_201395 [Meredithblackwellia eburnea MCA 4105]
MAAQQAASDEWHGIELADLGFSLDKPQDLASYQLALSWFKPDWIDGIPESIAVRLRRVWRFRREQQRSLIGLKEVGLFSKQPVPSAEDAYPRFELMSLDWELNSDSIESLTSGQLVGAVMHPDATAKLIDRATEVFFARREKAFAATTVASDPSFGALPAELESNVSKGPASSTRDLERTPIPPESPRLPRSTVVDDSRRGRSRTPRSQSPHHSTHSHSPARSYTPPRSQSRSISQSPSRSRSRSFSRGQSRSPSRRQDSSTRKDMTSELQRKSSGHKHIKRHPSPSPSTGHSPPPKKKTRGKKKKSQKSHRSDDEHDWFESRTRQNSPEQIQSPAKKSSEVSSGRLRLHSKDFGQVEGALYPSRFIYDRMLPTDNISTDLFDQMGTVFIAQLPKGTEFDDIYRALRSSHLVDPFGFRLLAKGDSVIAFGGYLTHKDARTAANNLRVEGFKGKRIHVEMSNGKAREGSWKWNDIDQEFRTEWAAGRILIRQQDSRNTHQDHLPSKPG